MTPPSTISLAPTEQSKYEYEPLLRLSAGVGDCSDHMDTDRDDGIALDPSFFDGRFLVEIEAWDGNLHVGLSSDSTPQEYRFQGGLNYVCGFQIDGRVVAPQAHRAKTIRLWLSPFGSDMRFGPDDLDEVGQLRIRRPKRHELDLSATLLMPEAALPVAATCLGSVWKYVHIWTFDEDAERASVSAFSFSSTVHKNLDGWIAGG
ncbi:MAG: hypothetical protein JWR47_3760 [Phenylobacterium sp.]|nr:hypothetical protein [Phenylobacterium sp.]MDB5500078.1 hypothetical protein [Phenylobacterium sp.]